MKTYGWSEEHTRKKISSAKGWVYFNWAMESEATVFGISRERKTDGYIQQEKKRLLAKQKANGKT